MGKDIKSPTRMSKQELEDQLLELGVKKEELSDGKGNKLKRTELLSKYNEIQNKEEESNVLSDVEEVDDFGLEVSEEDPAPEQPKNSDPGWMQFVMGKFMDDEVDGPNPRVEGLRRVAGELVGEIMEEGCDLVASPTEENGFRACVKAWGIFVTSRGLKRFEALADAHPDNCLENYATYLVAMADTRAKGRMYRNALGLRRVVAAEEISKTLSMTSDTKIGGAIHSGQISMIRLMSERNGFSITEILDDLGIKYEINDKTGDVNLQTLTYEEALGVSTEMRKRKEMKEKG